MFNVARKWASVREPWLLIHPADADREGMSDGDTVRVWNERGEVRLKAKISSDVQPGLVVSYMVRWGANANATTSDEPADMGGDSTFHTNHVSIRLMRGASPRMALSQFVPLRKQQKRR